MHRRHRGRLPPAAGGSPATDGIQDHVQGGAGVHPAARATLAVTCTATQRECGEVCAIRRGERGGRGHARCELAGPPVEGAAATGGYHMSASIPDEERRIPCAKGDGGLCQPRRQLRLRPHHRVPDHRDHAGLQRHQDQQPRQRGAPIAGGVVAGGEGGHRHAADEGRHPRSEAEPPGAVRVKPQLRLRPGSHHPLPECGVGRDRDGGAAA
mmetsp:Transcript_42343/g.75870  ORF Transcript_42343/g.75870 Transcript_42343/m.75870 type:complete len:211 (-) Transcript_42343:2185-2817(-)